MVKLESAFENISKYKNSDNGEMNRDVFINLLKEYGEKIDEKEIQDCLQVLRGDSNIKNLPENINFQYLFEELLRFEATEKDEKEK